MKFLEIYREFRKKGFLLRNFVVYVFLILLVLASCSKKDNVTTTNQEIPSTSDSTSDSDNISDSLSNLPEYAQALLSADWETNQVSSGIVWKYYHFDNLFSANASITIFDIDLNDKKVKIHFPYANEGELLYPSREAEKIGALVATNGSFFNHDVGGLGVYFRLNNKNIFPGYRVQQQAALIINEDDEFSIIARPDDGYDNVEAKTILAGGPHLVMNDNVISHDNSEYAPRTAYGITNDNHLIAIVVDGRFPSAKGLTLNETGKVMKALGCPNAINFDGGGSSLAWVKGHGIVNYPYDNHLFDHEGERPVGNAITFSE